MKQETPHLICGLVQFVFWLANRWVYIFDCCSLLFILSAIFCRSKAGLIFIFVSWLNVLILRTRMPRSNKKKKASPKYPGTVSLVDVPSIALDGAPSIMVQRCIASAARHGIKLIPGRANPAAGDCAFESTIFNVNDRNCF